MLSTRPASRSPRFRDSFAGIVSAKGIFNGFALFLTGNTAEHFSVGGARTQSIHSNPSIRELCTHGSSETRKSRLDRRHHARSGPGRFKCYCEVMITEDPFFKRGTAF